MGFLRSEIMILDLLKFTNPNSSCAPVFCGVPQGSMFGPLLFTVYMLTPMGQILHRHDIDFYRYADDTQLYVSHVLTCLAEI